MTSVKLLAIYYAYQQDFLNNLAAPLSRSVKPIVALAQNDYQQIAQVALPYLLPKFELDGLTKTIETLFTRINNGEIKPTQFSGYDMEPEKIVDQLEVHDAFLALFQGFFDDIEADQVSNAKKIKSNSLDSLNQLSLTDQEGFAMKNFLKGTGARTPVTIPLNKLQQIVDNMYEFTCDLYGPGSADVFLSNAVKHSAKRVPTFETELFL